MPQLQHYDFTPRFDIEFEPESHTYKLDGTPTPGVTKMMSEMGLSNAAQWADERSRNRGRAVHLACNYVDDGSYDPDSTHPELRPYVDEYSYAVQKFKARPVPNGSELLVASKMLWACGILDNLWEVGTELWLIDLKTGSMPALVGVQLAGYKQMLKETYGIEVDSCLAIQLKGTGGAPVTKLCDEPKYTAWFFAAAQLWHERERHGLIYRPKERANA